MDTKTTQATFKPARGSMRRYAPLLIILAGFLLFWIFDLGRYVSMQSLSDNRDFLQNYVTDNFAASLIIYGLVYAVATAFSFPGAVFLTLAGGFLFGTWLGGVATVVAATLGATAIFLAAKTAFGDVMRNRAAPYIARLRDGFHDNAASYLLFLRLVPLFPFWLVNIVPAFLGVPLRIFIITTFFGIMPGSFVYTSVGNGIGAVLDAGETPDLGIIFETEVIGPIIALALLSLVPIMVKTFRKKRNATPS